jgi:hypothetical protein
MGKEFVTLLKSSKEKTNEIVTDSTLLKELVKV